MWTWRRKEPGSPPEAATPAPLPVTRAEWRSLPPIQRVVAEHPLINPVQRFSASLTSWRSPAYLEPLGHRVGPAEPSGVIDGLARAPMAPPDMPVVQRSARKRGVLSRLWGMSVQRAAEPAGPVTESRAPEQESVPAVQSYEEPLPDEPGPAFEPTVALEPTATLVLPAVAAASPDADRPPMPLTTAGSSARPPVRTVQAIRSETPSAPVPTPEPAAEPRAVETFEPDHDPVVSTPEPVDVETVPVQVPDPLPAEPPTSEVVTPRPALPVVQRTEQVEAAPRRLGLGAPIVPDSVQAEVPSADVPAVEDNVAEVDAPLAGDAETPVLPTVSTPAEVAREERTFPAMPVETPTSPTSVPAVQRSVVESALELPSPNHRDVSQAGASVRKPVQRLRDESPVGPISVQGPIQRLREETPAEPLSVREPLQRHESPGEPASVQRPVQRLRDESPLGPISVERPVQRYELSGEPAAVQEPVQRYESPGEPAPVHRPVQRLRDESPGELASVRRPVQRLRDEPPAAQRPLQRRRDESPVEPTFVQRPVQRLRDEPPQEHAEAPILVARALEPPPSLPTVASSRSSPDTTFHPPEPPRIRSGTTATPEPPGTPGGSVSAPPASVISTSPLPVARVVDGTAAVSPAPAAVDQRPTLTALLSGGGATPLPSVSPRTPLMPETFTVKPVVQRQDAEAFHQPTTMPPPARPAETRSVQRTVPSEPVADVKSLVLNLPPAVVPRQPEPPVVQRDPETPPPPEPVAPPPATPVPATAQAAQAAQAAQPETEELVKKLFDPLLRRLKTELRLDRERRGALTDRPH
ncbi:hypothetical protein [Amycolatopsis sp. CB00013]|uniref:hypothetical protein n=1 Tax=Amycolatopsis sp. CB00013 TaxID=1703945 RepID=UPI0013014C7C|nr:hypothetical protein [Amycolatopsis sp. CB00013]